MLYEYKGRFIEEKLVLILISLAVLCTPTFGQTTAVDWLERGNALYNQDKYDESIEAYDEALRLDPNNVDVLYSKGRALNRLGKTIEANETIAKAEELGLVCTYRQLVRPGTGGVSIPIQDFCFDVYKWIKFLKDPNIENRQVYARDLGDSKDPRAVEPLIQALNDTNSQVREEAARSLGKLNDSRAVEPLIQALKDNNSDIRTNAAEALGKIKDPKAEEALGAYQINKVNVLVEQGEATTEDVEKYIQDLKDENSTVREIAALDLRLIKDPDHRSVEPLIEALNDKEIQVRLRAADTLGEIGDARAVDPLIRSLKEDSNSLVKGSAARALGTIGDVKAVEPLIDSLNIKSTHSDCDLSEDIAIALGRIRDRRAVDPLIKCLQDYRNGFEFLRRAAAEALGKIGDKRAVEPLIEALKDGCPSVRSYTAWALGEIEDKKATDPLINALRDEDEGVRTYAVLALVRVGPGRFSEAVALNLKNEKSMMVKAALILTSSELTENCSMICENVDQV
jgi:HEAT repeat protein